jgi:hypothetical protein
MRSLWFSINHLFKANEAHQPTRHKAKAETKKRLFAVGWMFVF